MSGGTITTPIDLISEVLNLTGVLGVGQEPDPEDVNRCFIQLNAMMAIWSKQRWLVYHLLDESWTATGAQSFTVGIGGDINVARPDRLESAYVRLLPIINNMPIDSPLTLIESREDYSRLGVKRLVSFPVAIWADTGFPLTTCYPWPVPTNAKYEIHVIIKDTFAQFATLTDAIVLPPEYINCLMWNLAVRVAPLFRIQNDPAVIVLAKEALNIIRGANAQIPSLKLAMGLSGGGAYDVTLGNLNGLPFAS